MHLLLLILAWTPVLVAQSVCSDHFFSIGATAVNDDCCPQGVTGSGHRRRRRQQQQQQQGCAVPTTCPSRACATTFTTFFEECNSQLQLLPEIAQYQQLHTDCIASFPDSRPPTASCTDDAQGLLASYGISCAILVRTGPCDTDLSTTGWPVQSGTSMRNVCPTTCRDGHCVSGDATAGCQLLAARDHWTNGDTVTGQAVGCSSIAVAGAIIMGRRVSGPHASKTDAVQDNARWAALEDAQLSQEFLTWHTSALASRADYGRWELALVDSGTRAVLSELATVWIAPSPEQLSIRPELYPEEWGLPVVHLSLEGGRSPTETPQGALITVRGDSLSGTVHVRGASSSSYAKQSYTLKFDDGQELGVHEWHGHHHTRGHLILTTLFDDTTYVRQKLVFDLWKAMSEYQGTHRLVPETFFAVVYLNGKYHGLYLGCDRIDDEFVRHLGFPAGEGNLYKAVSHDANFYLTMDGQRRGPQSKGSGSGLRAGYEKVEGVQSDWTDLEQLVAAIGGGSDAEVAAGTTAGRIDVSEFEDWLILVSYSLSDDSAAKNSYLCEYSSTHSPRYCATTLAIRMDD